MVRLHQGGLGGGQRESGGCGGGSGGLAPHYKEDHTGDPILMGFKPVEEEEAVLGIILDGKIYR